VYRSPAFASRERALRVAHTFTMLSTWTGARGATLLDAGACRGRGGRRQKVRFGRVKLRKTFTV
jgi:hypothetical protein